MKALAMALLTASLVLGSCLLQQQAFKEQLALQQLQKQWHILCSGNGSFSETEHNLGKGLIVKERAISTGVTMNLLYVDRKN